MAERDASKQAVDSADTDSGFSIAKLRRQNYERRRQAYKARQGQSDSKVSVNQQYWEFAHELTSVVLAQAIIFGPLERLKIVLQVNPLVKYANPQIDRPKNMPDLWTKVTN